MMLLTEEDDEKNTELESDETAQMVEIQIEVSDEIVLEEEK